MRAQVKTDQRAALALAQLHAKGLLPAVWVPPAPVREQRATLAQRAKLIRLSTQAKNRLHAALHRHHLPLPEGDPFAPGKRDWWLALPVSASERARIQSDLETLEFAKRQVVTLTTTLATEAAQDERVPLLIQLPGFSVINSLTVLAAVGDIGRFESAKHLVGYAGLGARVHDSGQLHRTGRTLAPARKCRCHQGWPARFARRPSGSRAGGGQHSPALAGRVGPPGAALGAQQGDTCTCAASAGVVAIARKLLITVWHVLSKAEADRFAEPARVARKLLTYTYLVGRVNRRPGQSTAAYVREQLDRLHLGAELTGIDHGRRPIPLPPSRLTSDLT